MKGTITMGAGLAMASLFPLPSMSSSQERRSREGKLGVALVGLGNYSNSQLAPALQETSHCYLAGIVTGTQSKEAEWAKKYDIPDSNIYNYDNFDQISSNKDIDIVYVVLPNSMHAEFAIRAAEAGKHVISEKPMATSGEDCRKMIAACKKAGKKLSVGYRLHFDPYHLKMMEIGRKKLFGALKGIEGGHAFVLNNPNAWRLDKELAGGGPLMDLGIYSLQGSIYTTGEAPTHVLARDTTKKKDFFGEVGVEGTLEWEMHFPSGLKAVCRTSYEDRYNYLRTEMEKGKAELQPAYSYGGLKGLTPDGAMKFTGVNQQALQMDDFALCIKENRDSIVPGEMGWRDVYIMEMIYESARTGSLVELKDLPKFIRRI